MTNNSALRAQITKMREILKNIQMASTISEARDMATHALSTIPEPEPIAKAEGVWVRP